MFDNVRADIARCNRRSEIVLNPALWAVLLYRFNRWGYKSELPIFFRLPVRFVSIVLDLAVRMILHVELPATADIRTRSVDSPYGLHCGWNMGPDRKNCTLAHGVTIGHGRGGRTEGGRVTFDWQQGLCWAGRCDNRTC